MKSILILAALLFSFSAVWAQKETTKDALLRELSDNVCKCVDSINTSNKASEEIVKEINRCLRESAGAYQLGAKLAAVDTTTSKRKKRKQKTTVISVSQDDDSKEYQKYYFELEAYAMDNCKSLKAIVKSDNKESDHSSSKNPEALAFYAKGDVALDSKNFAQAIKNYQAALKIDSLFSFCWDNLGIAYRRSEQYEKALWAYRKSIAVNPAGKVPWQNIAIVYEFQKEYMKAIDAYEELAKLDKDNPEVYYGIGRNYAFQIVDLEKGLDNLCIAYSLYVAQKSPYRTDAEKVISYIFQEMKKQGKEKRFNEILKKHNITRN